MPWNRSLNWRTWPAVMTAKEKKTLLQNFNWPMVQIFAWFKAFSKDRDSIEDELQKIFNCKKYWKCPQKPGSCASVRSVVFDPHRSSNFCQLEMKQLIQKLFRKTYGRIKRTICFDFLGRIKNDDFVKTSFGFLNTIWKRNAPRSKKVRKKIFYVPWSVIQKCRNVWGNVVQSFVKMPRRSKKNATLILENVII